MKAFSKRKGWLFNLIDGPYDGTVIRLGWQFPNGERDPIDQYITYPSGVRYKRRQAVWKSKGVDHNKGDLRFNKDGSEYWEFVYVEGSGGK